MPKQNHVIAQFNGGLVLDIAKEDLPDGVLTNNTRNVHSSRSGNLIGFRERVQYLDNTGASSPFYAGTFNDEGIERLFHLESTATPRIRSYAQGSTTVNTKDFPSGCTVTPKKTSHAQRLNHLFLGTGRENTDKPLWYGKHNHPQFGVNAPSDYQVILSELLSPTQLSSSNSFPLATDSINIGLNTYMISRDSANIHKFTNYTIVDKSEVPFNALSAICKDSEAGFFWVYERGTKSLHRLNESLEVVSSLFIEGLPDDGKFVTCIAVADGYIYMQRMDPDAEKYNDIDSWLYRVSRVTGNTSVNAQDNSYMISTVTFRPFVESEQYFESYTILDREYKLGRKALFVDSDQLYAVVRFRMDLNVNYFNSSDPDDQTNRWTEIKERYRSFTLYSKADPASGSDTGNTFVGAINFSDGATTFSNSEINLIIGNQNYLHTDVINATATNLDLYNLDYDGEVYRLRIDISTITGDAHISSTPTAIPGFTAADIKPTLSFGDGIIRWFSQSNPSRIGSLSDTTVGNITESVANISMKKIPGGFATAERSYHYAFSFIYDGYMESPLSDSISSIGDEGFGFSLTIQIPQENINRRVTGMNVYRAEGSASGREESFRLVDYVSFEPAFPTDTIGSEDVYIIEYNDRKKIFELGPAFNSNSGIPETLQNTLPHYGLSVALDDFLFIADCYHPQIEQAKFMLFRSQPYSFSSFNWEIDVMRLEGTPTAMASFNSRIIVFDKNNMYVVNPTNLTIEETFHGIGAINNRCVKVTDAGLLVAGTDHLRLFNGQDIQLLSQRITLHSGADLSAYSNDPAENTFNALRDYQYFMENATDIVLVNNKTEKSIALFGTIGSDTIGYIYNLQTQFWSRMVKTDYSFNYGLALNTGELLVYKSASVDKLFGSHLDTTILPMVAELVPFDAKDQNIDKWFYEVRIDYLGDEGDVAVKVAVDNQNYSANLTESETGVFPIPDGNHRKGKKIKLRLTGTAKVRSISLIFRPKQVRS